MPSLSAQKLIRKLRQRKYRWQERLFVAEGPKLIEDLIASGLRPQSLWSSNNFPGSEEIEEDLLSKLSHLSTANQVIGIFPFPKIETSAENRILILDGINDPGNLGTLLRTADWFGFKRVICTAGTADIYNAKAVQSTMGSLGRLKIDYASIPEIQQELSDYQIFIAEMHGQEFNSLSADGSQKLALVMGSESHGPSADWKESGTLITIPRINESGIDSLNVGIAGGILMQHFAS